VPEPAAESSDRSARQPELNEIKRQEKLPTAQSPTADAPDNANAAIATPQATASEPRQPDPGQLRKMSSDIAPANSPPPADNFEDQARVGDAFQAEALDAKQSIQKVERAIDANHQSRPDEAVRFAAPQAAIATESLMQVAPTACSDEQKSDLGQWWQCIESLRQAGLAEAADLEFEMLKKNYPDFEAPE
jgi:hypothetical protein